MRIHSSRKKIPEVSSVRTKACPIEPTPRLHSGSTGDCSARVPRNEFHASVQQAFGKHLVFGGEYIWKYTRNAFDFSILGNTPIFFPINWHNSKIPGYALHVEVPVYHSSEEEIQRRAEMRLRKQAAQFGFHIVPVANA